MPTQPQTAVVILNWNGKALLDRFLENVIDQSPGADIVVADNGSSDGSVAWIRERFPDVTLVTNHENLGFAGGYNAVLRQVHATYYVLLNSDVEVTPGWLEPLTGWLDRHPACAACQPAIRSFSRRQWFEHAGAAGGFIDKWGYPFCRGRLFNTVEPDEGQYKEATEVFWASGACLAIRADAFHKAGGFDERFFAHMEEIDLCWRLKRGGNTIHCIPKSTVFHVGGGTLPAKNPRKTYLNFRNNLMMLYKNLPPERLLRVLAARLIFDKMAAVKFLLEGDWKDGFAVLKAYRNFYGNLGRARKQRKLLEANNLPFHVTRIYLGSVVAQYFFRGIKKFSGLGNKFT